MRLNKLSTLALATLLLGASSLRAAITFVDSTGGGVANATSLNISYTSSPASNASDILVLNVSWDGGAAPGAAPQWNGQTFQALTTSTTSPARFGGTYYLTNIPKGVASNVTIDVGVAADGITAALVQYRGVLTSGPFGNLTTQEGISNNYSHSVNATAGNKVLDLTFANHSTTTPSVTLDAALTNRATAVATNQGGINQVFVSDLNAATTMLYTVTDTLDVPATGFHVVAELVADNTAPVISFQAPANNSFVATGQPLLWATLTDNVGIQLGSITLTANVVSQNFAFDSVGLTRTGTALADGYYAVSLTASDGGANSFTAGLSFTVDTLSPTAQVFPANNSFTSVTPVVWAQLSDLHIVPGALTLTVNGSNGHNYANGSITSTAIPVYGLNSVTLTATDLAGNTLVRNWTFTLSDDVTPPVVSAGSPTGLTNNAQVAVTVSISDAGVGVSSAGISVTVNTQAAPFAYDGTTLTLTAALANGDQYITVLAADQLGNTATLYSFQFTLFSQHCSYTYTPTTLTAMGTIGSAGSGNGQFSGLWDVAIGPDGGFYTSEFNNNRIQRFGPDGSYLGQWAGTRGYLGITVDTAGFVYVADFVNSRVSKFNADGTPANSFGGGSSNNLGQPAWPRDVAVSSQGDIYITRNAFGLGRYAADGSALGSLSTAQSDGNALFVDSYGYVYVSSGDFVRKFSADLSTELLSFATGGTYIYGLTVDGDGNVYATTTNDLRIFSPAGTLLSTSNGGVNSSYSYSWGTGSYSFGAKENTGVAIYKNKLYRAFLNNVQIVSIATESCGIDTTLPHAAVPLPLGGATLVTNTALVRAFLYDSGGSGIDLASAEMRIDGVKVAAVTSMGHISFTATSLANGVHVVSVDVRDKAGNSAPTLVWQFTVALPTDTVAPTSTTPAPVGLTSTTQPRVSAVLADNAGGSGINTGSIRMLLNGTQVAASLTGSTLVYAPVSLAEGDYSALVTFKDNAGNDALPLAWNFSTKNQYCQKPLPNPVSITAFVTSTNMYGIAVNAAGQIYVNQNETMTYYDALGNSLGSFNAGTCGTERGFALDSSENVIWAKDDGGTFCWDTLTRRGPTTGNIITTAFSPGIDTPTDVAEDLNGNFWLTDISNDRVYKFNSSLGSVASYSGFNNPYSVAVGPNNRIYVADTSNHRVRVLDAVNGTVLQTIGSFGNGNGQFNSPQGVAIDPAGYIYVADTNNNRIQVFSEAGVYQLTFGVGLFNSPRDLAIRNGKIHVVDQNNNRVMVFSGASAPTGCVYDTVKPFATSLSPAPASVTKNAQVLIRASLGDVAPGSGVLNSSVSMKLDGLTVSAATDGITVTYTAATLSAGQHTVTVDLRDVAGNLADQLVWSFEVATEYCSVSYTPLTLTSDGNFGSSGSGPGQFTTAYDAVFSPSGEIFVLDFTLARVQRFSASRTYQSQWGSFGSGVGQFNGPRGIASDSAGNIYVADSGNNRVSKFDSAGNSLNSYGGGTTNSFGVAGVAAGQFSSMRSIAVGPDNSIYVSQIGGTNRLQRFAADGTFLSSLTNTVAAGESVHVDSAGFVYFGRSPTVLKFNANLSAQSMSFNSTVGVSRIAVDTLGNILLLNGSNIRIHDSSGAFVVTQSGGTGYTGMTMQNEKIVRVGNSVASHHTFGTTYCGFDTVSPQASAPAPSGGSITNTATPLIWARLNDNHPSSGVNLGSITVTVNGIVVSHQASAQALTIQAGTLNPGIQTVTVDFKDQAGNQANQLVWSFQVVLDSIAPVISAPSPLGLTTNANTLITAALSDVGTGINTASVVMRVDGVTVTAITNGVTVSYTASALADGVHTVSVDAKDLAGNAATQLDWQFTVGSDVTAPVVSSVSSPSTAAPVTLTGGSSLNVTYAYTEVNPSYISITVRSGGTIIASKLISAGLVSPTATRTDSLEIHTGAGSGTYDVVVEVVDVKGQSGFLTSTASVYVDKAAPVASGQNPANAATVTDVAGNTTISLALTDGIGAGVAASQVKLYLDGILQTGAVASGTGVSFAATGLAAGLHSVTVEFNDTLGNADISSWSFTMVRDVTNPVVAVVGPLGASPWYSHASGTVDVSYYYTETNPAYISITVRSGATVVGQETISAGLLGGVTTTSSVTLFGGAAAGAYDVVLTVVDMAGNQGAATTVNSVVVDNSPPTASAGLPAGGSIVQTASPVVSATLADAGGSAVSVGTIVMRIDGSIVAATTSASAVSFNTSGLADGPHTVDVDLQDRSGNQAQRLSWSFRTDVSNPDVTITGPLEGGYVRGTPTVEALSTDAGSGVTRTAFFQGATLIGTTFFNGSAWNDGTGLSPSASVRWDTTVLTDGIYILKAQSVDLVGNTGTSSNRMVTVDNTPPSITITAVLSPTQYQAQTITGQLTEQNFAQLRVNGILAQVTGAGPSYTWKAVVPLISGPNGITVTATDLAGNSFSVVTGITFDPTATVHFLTPASSGNYRATVAIEGAAPSATRWLTYEVSANNGVTWNSVSTGASVVGTVTTLTKTAANGWRLDWNTVADGLADGNQYQLRIIAYDEVNVQLGSAVIGNFTVDNTAPQMSYIVLPAPVTVTYTAAPGGEVYTDIVTVQGTITETGSGIARVRLEQFNSSNDHISDSPADLPVLADNKFSRNLRLVEGLNRVLFTTIDQAGNSVTATSNLYYVRPQNSGTICAPGGVVTAPDGTSVNIPANALISCASVSIKTILRSLLASPADSYLKIVGEGHQIEPLYQVFQAQVEITLPYTDADLDPDANGIPDYQASTLKVLFWDGSVWQNVGVDSINQTTKRVKVRSNHLGLFALAADTAPTPTEAKVFLTKNPFRYGTGNPTAFVYEMPKPGKVTIKIYDITGDLVRTLVEQLPQNAGRYTQVWDGLNNFDRFVGSGAYFFRFEAELSDGSKTVTTKAIGVLK